MEISVDYPVSIGYAGGRSLKGSIFESGTYENIEKNKLFYIKGSRDAKYCL